MIEIDNLELGFAGTDVLTGVSLTVDQGEMLGLVGPNGAGKTTLLRTINGYLHPDGGTVRLAGDPVQSLSADAIGRRVATVPQEGTFAFEFPVRDIVAMGRTPHQSRFSTMTHEDRAKVQQALDRTETADLADRQVSELSGGQRQRVLLARALAQSTPALLLDEPTANLDINHQVQTLSLVSQLTSDGKTIVAAIHDLELAARFCDRVALLTDGQIGAVGPPADVLTPERLEDAFGIETAVGTNTATGTPTVTALADSD